MASAEVKAQAPAVCERCHNRRNETYHYMRQNYIFDVERAKQMVQDGREPVELEEESVRDSVRYSRIFKDHLDHIQSNAPGIIAHLFYPENDEIIHAHLLIDGNHRAARALRDGQPYYAYVLTEEESKAILIRSPDQPDGPGREPPVDMQPETTRAYEEKYADSLPYSMRARNIFAGATTHDRRGFGPFGVYVARAEGARKWDVKGQPLIDYWMGHGALLMGHGFAPVVEAVQRQVALGTHFGACHPLEVRWAELVRELIPAAERVRFTASGTEATLLALRVARAYTGRKRIVRFDSHFHGWHDEAMSHFYGEDTAGLNPGALDHVSLVSPLTLDPVLQLLEANDVAAVILEPGGGGGGGLPWSPEYLSTLRQATRDHGALLIFDEVISGFRHSPGGVQKVSGVTPDITTLAKILCGGLPGGAVAGKTEIMAVFGDGTDRDGRHAQIPHTGTFNANPLSAAAGIAMLEHIADGVAQETAYRNAERFAAGVNELAKLHKVDIHCYTNGTSVYHLLIGARRAKAPLGPSQAVAHLYRDHPRRYALFRRALLLEGVDIHPLHGWVSAVHDEAIVAETLEAVDRAMARVRSVAGFRR